ncbi:MAG: zinc-ribbon domain-containing protein [Acholeplasmataceae bacterium]
MKYCAYCAKEIEENAKFCPSCGEAVEQDMFASSMGNNRVI